MLRSIFYPKDSWRQDPNKPKPSIQGFLQCTQHVTLESDRILNTEAESLLVRERPCWATAMTIQANGRLAEPALCAAEQQQQLCSLSDDRHNCCLHRRASTKATQAPEFSV
jgi:predicted acyl esterase